MGDTTMFECNVCYTNTNDKISCPSKCDYIICLPCYIKLVKKICPQCRSDYVNRKPNGTLIDGEGTYIGSILNGMRHGMGTNTFPCGDVYKGEWVRDTQHGKGTYTWENGSTYVGEWEDGNYHGSGELTMSGRRVYSGEWKSNNRHGYGYGKNSSSNGAEYEGEWKRDKPHGLGKCVWSNGSVYEGGWCDGKMTFRKGTILTVCDDGRDEFDVGGVVIKKRKRS